MVPCNVHVHVLNESDVLVFIVDTFCPSSYMYVQVYAVEASDIAQQARSIIERNGLGEVVSIVQCRGEELQLPEKVDLIISEWMGTMLIVSD